MGKTVMKVTPCTPLQEAMLSAADTSSGGAYSNNTMFNVSGDLERLRGCWQEMVQRHEILRTCFVSTDMQTHPYVQVVLNNFEIEFGHLNSSTLKDAVIELESSTNNKNTPPYSLNILRSECEQRLLVSMHHALYDGVALSVLYDEVEKLYHGLSLPTMVSFTPFLQHVKSMDTQSSDKFWESTLHGYQQLYLEDVSDRPNQVQKAGTRVQQLVTKIPLSEIEKNTKKYSTTSLAVFHSVWAATMSELFKTTDICFGNVVSGRTAPVDSIERLVAPCFNTIPTRLVDIHKSTYLEAFRKLQNANADSLPFQFTPLRRLQSKFSSNGSRLFDTLFILQQPSKDLDSSIWSIVEDNGAMDFPLVCEIIPKPGNDALEIVFHSSTSILSEKDAYNLIQKFENTLEAALENPRRQIISSSLRAQIITTREAREKKRLESRKDEGRNKVMNRLESEIRDVIAEFTDVPLQKIGRDTSIFRLGLDSISTVQVASLLRARGHNLLARDVLQNPTIAKVASYLEQNVNRKSEENVQFNFSAFYQRYRDMICARTALPDENIEAIRPCTAVQQGMLAQSLHSDGQEYINSMSLELLQGHSIKEVRDTWTKLCISHEMLRTIFAQTGDPEYPFVMVTFTKDSFVTPWFENREQAPSRGIDRLQNPWDMTVDQKDNRNLLIFTAHHALYDAQSMQMIFSDFTKLYHSREVASRPSISTLLSSILKESSGALDEKRAFWEHPENRIVVNKFPDLTPLRITAFSNVVREAKSQASLKELEDRCRNLGVTMQAAGQATWARLLMAYTGENVTTFGMTLSGRSVCDDANLIAFPTIVTLPVNCNVTGSNSQLLSRTVLSNAQLHRHQFTPLTSIQKWGGYPEGRIFDTLFAYQKLPDDEDVMNPPWKVVDEEATVDYVVSLEVQPTRLGEIIIRLSFREDIIPAVHAEIIVKQFDALLLDTLRNPDHPCSVAPEVGIDLLSITPAQDPVLPDSVTLLHQYIERGAKTWPDKVALEFATCLEPGNYRSRKWTYQQLEDEANKVAQMLHTRGTAPGEIIAICFDKCAEASFAIIGIMKAGCGYVALDPNAPADRLKFIVEDSAAKLIISAGNPAQALRTFVDGEMIDLTDPAVLCEFSSEMPQLSREISPQDISYCLYTSGTTGTPKGCLLTHENAIQAMLAFQRLFAGHWTTDSKWLQFASFHFDVSVLEQFWSWSVGICVASAPRDLIFEDIPGAIQQLGITHIDLTPSLARLLHPDDVPSLCKGVFITGGEQLKQEILDLWGEHACIYNGYGPTEATIGVTMYPRVPKNGKPSNIGPQFDNVGSFVLKPGTELPVLRGGIGELCVSGKLVGKGYLNRPELTTERFPTLTKFNERVYRTGDLVRILHDGTFLFLGRADDQVKLRGQRLELSEINEVIKKSRNDLEEVVTLVLKHKAQAKEQLVTFFVTSVKTGSDVSGVVPFIRNAYSKQLAAIFNDLSLETLQNLSLSEQIHADWTGEEKNVVKDIVGLFPVEVPELTRSSNIFQLGIDSITMVTFSHSLRNCGYNNATNATVRSNPTIGSLVKALLVTKPDESKENLYLTVAKQNIAGFSQQHIMAISKELGFQSIKSSALSVAPQAIIQAAWMAAIQKVISPSITTIGIVTSGRTMDFEEVEKVAGPLFNTVPFHLPIKTGTQVSSLVEQCHSINMKMQGFQHTPLTHIRKWISAGTSGPLFDVLFVFQRPDVNEERFLNRLGRETVVSDDDVVADYPLALEATLSHSNTLLSLKIVGKSSVAKESMLSVLADDNKEVVCSEVAILAKLDNIHIDEPRSIFELGLDSIDVIKLSSRLRKNEIELSVSEIIKCQTICKILEKAKVSESKQDNSPSMEELMKISKGLETHLKPSLPLNYERVFPATPLQESILKEMIQSNFRRYFNVHLFQLNTSTQEEKLMRAVDYVIKNSPILRTSFLEVHDPQSSVNYAQIVRPDWEKATKTKVLVGNESWSLGQLLKGAEEKLRDGWASIEKHMFGMFPIHFGEKRFIMMAISHAIYDGGSLPMIHDDIRKVYYGNEITKRPDYSCYIAEAFHSINNEAKEFWKATLWNSPPSTFPKQEPSQTHESITHRYESSSVFSLQEVKSFCNSSNITLQTLGQTCWALVLAELMGQLDVLFGSVLACRDTTEAGQVNFPLFNTVAVRSVICGTLDQMLREMQDRSIATRQFQHFPLRMTQAYALGGRDASTKDTTLFDTLFTYQGARPSEEIDPLYSSIDGSSDVEFAICVEMEIEDKSDSLYWTAACKSEARNFEQTKEIIANLDMILGRIMKNKQEQAIMSRPDGISICGFRTFQPLVTNRPQKLPSRDTISENWSETELKLRESISIVSGLPEEEIHRDSTIFQLGLDSITILKLPALLKKHKIELTASKIMKYLTIHSTPWFTHSDFDRLQASWGPIDYIMPATAGQRYMVKHWQGSQGYLFCPTFKFKLYNGFDRHRLDFAWFKLQCQHDILRTGFHVAGPESKIAQIIYKKPSNKIVLYNEATHPGRMD
ncbi:hypothetical protein DID88_010300 [Monilinia fructigena]|uniref:Carrier domain-containing protein n=1 Tax=Monilinia fructigena TaxID=38457 RepID=A0A395IM38_9HELO|nr:hypothetical protein DID88_010300 [Monilinia fructigena]